MGRDQEPVPMILLNMKKMYIHKIVNVLGSDGKLAQC